MPTVLFRTCCLPGIFVLLPHDPITIKKEVAKKNDNRLVSYPEKQFRPLHKNRNSVHGGSATGAHG